ncbi:MAG: C39 family peptidase [Chloroflexota bacterium]
MSLKRLGMVAVLILLLIPAAVFAVEQPEPDDASSAYGALPTRVRLEGLQRVWQDFNRCSAAALTMQLSYWREDVNYWSTIDGLNPHSDDVSVRLAEMTQYAANFGLNGIERTGGTLEIIKSLVANGFPVLIENVYYDGSDVMLDWMSHNKVVSGYDDELGVFYTFDSLLGFGADNTGRPVPYDQIDDLWRPLNRGYFVLYEPEDEARLRDVMGPHWDEDYNAQWTYEMVQRDLESEGSDSFDLFNMGTALLTLDRPEEAADYFDQARQLGLPMRMMWYQFGPFEAYLQTGRYDDVLALARNTLRNEDGIEEVYYYVARAYIAQGQPDHAIANLEVALWRNPNFIAAQQLMAELNGEAG